MADLRTPSSFLRINDITLKVPPKNISIIKQDYNASISTLRSQISTHVKSGHRTIGIVVETYFADGHNAINGEETDGKSWINEQLGPLLVQVRKCPFVSIENEKLRKEIFGTTGKPTAKSANMAAVVKNITIESKAREPGIYHVRFHMEWFNYLPFSHKFGYKEISENGVERQIDIPGSEFKKFYENGTKREVGFGSARASAFINALDPSTPERTEDNFEIIYKEYKRINLESPDFEDDLSKLINLDFDESEEVITPLRSNLSKYETTIQTLQEAGWQFLDDFEASVGEPGRVIYRYRKYTVPVINPDQTLESGVLLVESSVSSLDTKTVTIPLLGHTLPTSQFLGAADGTLIINFFANAELDQETPVATSDNLALFNAIVELTNINAVKFRRVAKNDSVFIKHPSAKLLKYKRYDENRLSVFNDLTGELDFFDPNEYLACVVQGTESQTVEGLPYCSRFSIKLTENYKAAEGAESSSEKIASGQVAEGTKTLLETLIDKYDIQPRKNKVVTTTSVLRKVDEVGNKYVDVDASRRGVPQGEPDFGVAQKLARYLDASLAIKDFEDSKDVLNDPDFIEKTSSELDEEYKSAVTVRDAASIRGLDPEDQERLRQAGTNEEFTAEANRIRERRSSQFIGGRDNRSPLSSECANEVAWDMIRILSKREEGSDILGEYEDSMQEFRSVNKVGNESCYPDMMLPRESSNPDFFFYNESETDQREKKRKLVEKAFERYEKVGQQYATTVADEEAPLVLSPEFRPSPGPPVIAPNIIGLGSDKKRKEETDTDKGFTQDPLNSDLQFENIRTAVNNFTDKTYSMRRSMPTFRLYVKENDINSFTDIDKDRLRKKGKRGIWRNFTEFYDLNAVADIRLVKTKDNPADLLVIRLVNTREDIVNKSYQDLSSKLSRLGPNPQRTLPSSGSTEGKEKKADLNQLDGVMLKEGSRIELRLGYEGNPNDLSVEFSGRISQIGGGDVVEIVCQGDGIELVQELKGVGVADEFTWSSNTQNIISEMLHNSPEVKSFGTINAKTFLGDISFFWRGAGGRTVVENIFAPSLFSAWSSFGSKSLKWTTRGLGFGALFGPIGAALGTLVGGAIGVGTGVKDAFFKFFKGSKFTIYEQTIWDVLQELTLRHPGIICDVIPFDRRSTIFFGYPDQMYFFRGPTYEEAIAMDGDDLETSVGNLVERNMQEVYSSKFGNVGFSKNKAREIARQQRQAPPISFGLPDLPEPDRGTGVETILSFMKQYRSYHMVTSEHDIIENGMMVNSDGVFNSIQIAHPVSSGDGNYDGSEGFSGYELTDEIKGDDDLNREYIKRQTLVFHNAHTDLDDIDLPERYAVGSLCKSLNNVYKGKIKILGRPEIKPHDVVFVYDTYNNIFGPVEVAAVIHTFSYQTGWVTDIIPHMIVTPTTSTAVVHINAIQRMVSSFYLNNLRLFYSGPIFKETGELDNSLLESNLAQEITNSEILDGVPGGIALGLTGQNLARTGKDIQRARKWGRVVKGAQKTKALSLLKAGGKLAYTRLAGATLPIIGDLLIDYATGFYTNWSKFRQPIMFMPVTRNGKPWYTALYGLNNNTESEAIEGVKNDLLKKADFYIDYMKNEFEEIFD